jgi:hypothetical protein
MLRVTDGQVGESGGQAVERGWHGRRAVEPPPLALVDG